MKTFALKETFLEFYPRVWASNQASFEFFLRWRVTKGNVMKPPLGWNSASLFVGAPSIVVSFLKFFVGLRFHSSKGQLANSRWFLEGQADYHTFCLLETSVRPGWLHESMRDFNSFERFSPSNVTSACWIVRIFLIFPDLCFRNDWSRQQ